MAILLLIWMALIFALSAQTASESSLTSAGFTYRVFSLVYPDFSEMTVAEQQAIISQFSFFIRKAAHFTLYFILGILAFLNAAAYKKIILPLKGMISFVFCVMYAASDEFHQLYVAGRAGQLRDVAIDSAGALLSILISMLIFKGVESKMLKKNLIKQNGELFDRLNDANGRIAELEAQLQEREGELESLNDQVLELRRELAERQAQKDEEPTDEVPVETVEEKKEQNEQPEIPTPAVIKVEDCVEYGAQVIGKIVVSAAGFSNRLTVDGDSSKRELVNLILGRTEVAKSEILDITSGEAEDSIKRYMIDRVHDEALEYFKSVMAQF